MPNWFKKIAETFNSKSASGRTGEQQRQFDRLSKWLDETAEHIEKSFDEKYQMLTENFSAAELSAHAIRTNMRKNLFMNLHEAAEHKDRIHIGMSHAIDVNIAKLERQDLEALSDKFTALHDICLKHNVKLDFFGFDMLPSFGVGNETGWRKNGVGIEVNTTAPYTLFKHPSYGLMHGDDLDQMRNKYPDFKKRAEQKSPQFR